MSPTYKLSRTLAFVNRDRVTSATTPKMRLGIVSTHVVSYTLDETSCFGFSVRSIAGRFCEGCRGTEARLPRRSAMDAGHEEYWIHPSTGAASCWRFCSSRSAGYASKKRLAAAAGDLNPHRGHKAMPGGPGRCTVRPNSEPMKSRNEPMEVRTQNFFERSLCINR